MLNRSIDACSRSRRLFVRPSSVILFDVEVRLEGSPNTLPADGQEMWAVLNQAPVNGHLSGVTHSLLTGCELAEFTASSRTFSVGFASIGGTGKGAGHSVSESTIRRGFHRALDRALWQWRALVGAEPERTVSVGDVLRLPFSSSLGRMERMVAAGYRLAAVAYEPGTAIVPPDASRPTLVKLASDLVPLLEFDERRIPRPVG